MYLCSLTVCPCAGPRRQKLQCTMLGLGMGEFLQTGPVNPYGAREG